MSLLSALSEVIGESQVESSAIPYELPTSLPNINMAISGRRDGGFPGGRLITIAGPESSGKTALATELMVAGQKKGGFAFLEDFEHAFHHPHASRLGLNYEQFYARKPAIAEEGFADAFKVMEVIRASQLKLKGLSEADRKLAVRTALGKTDVSKLPPIVGLFDSVAAMIPLAQDIDYTKQNMKTKNMELAAMLSIELKRLARDAETSGSTVILLNQLRNNPGIMFGDNTTEPGGNAPKYFASVMLRLRRVDKWYKEFGNNKSEVIGDVVELFVRKNKAYRPFKKTRYVFRTADPVGLDLIGTMIYLGKTSGVLGAKEGTTLTFDGKRKNIEEFDLACRADPALTARLVDYVMSQTNPVEDGPVLSDDDSDAFSGLGVGATATSIPTIAPPAAT